jgi:hypothetical protein
MGGLKWTGFGFTRSPPARIRAPPAVGHGCGWCHVWSACTSNHLRPTPGGTLRALSHAVESGKTHLWRPSLPNGRRTEGVMRVALGVHVIPLLTTVVPLGDCCPGSARRSSHGHSAASKRRPITTQLSVSVASARISCGTNNGTA